MARPLTRRRRREDAPIVRKNTIRLPGDVARRIRLGHPWVYREALGPRPMHAEAGTTIDLVDGSGEIHASCDKVISIKPKNPPRPPDLHLKQ